MKMNPISMHQKLNEQNLEKVTNYIPSIFIPNSRKDKIFVFFHGNG